jgi:ubiquinone/menaquinone biosynthesis C-methylase UbiE
MYLNKEYKNRIEFVNSFIFNDDISLLDIGGGGMSPNIPNKFRPMSKYISENINKSEKYLAMEIDDKKANRMKDIFNITNVLCDNIVTNTTIDNNSFKIVYSGLVFQYIWEIDLALQNIHRILDKNGVLYFDVPNTLYYRNILRYMIRGKSLLDTDNFNQINFSIPIIEKILNRNKFKIQEVSFIKGLKDNIIIPKNMYEFIGIKAIAIE